MIPCTVLIVDDSSSARSVVRGIVRQAGVRDERIFEARDGQEALALFEEAWIDLVLVDMYMPVMDGETFVRCVRSREDLADVRLIVVSSDQAPARHARLRALGIDGALEKPFRPRELLEAIQGALPSAAAA